MLHRCIRSTSSFLHRVLKAAMVTGGAMALAGTSSASTIASRGGHNPPAIAKPTAGGAGMRQQFAQSGNSWGERQECSAPRPEAGKSAQPACNPCAAKSPNGGNDRSRSCDAAAQRQNPEKSAQ